MAKKRTIQQIQEAAQQNFQRACDETADAALSGISLSKSPPPPKSIPLQLEPNNRSFPYWLVTLGFVFLIASAAGIYQVILTLINGVTRLL